MLSAKQAYRVSRPNSKIPTAELNMSHVNAKELVIRTPTSSLSSRIPN